MKKDLPQSKVANGTTLVGKLEIGVKCHSYGSRRWLPLSQSSTDLMEIYGSVGRWYLWEIWDDPFISRLKNKFNNTWSEWAPSDLNLTGICWAVAALVIGRFAISRLAVAEADLLISELVWSSGLTVQFKHWNLFSCSTFCHSCRDSKISMGFVVSV